MESALLQRGFQYGTAPNALVIGWNGGHAAATLPDGTPVSSGEGGGVRIGGGGAYQGQFSHHMFLPMDLDAMEGPMEGPIEGMPPPPDAPVELVDAVEPPMPEPAPEVVPDGVPEGAPDGPGESAPEIADI